MSESVPQFDTRAFRSALGTFTTGVTIITTRAEDGTPVGLTANSFNSVSLDPPMVLWSLAKSSRSLPAFTEASHWTVHILAAEQEELSNRFASRGEDKFAGLELEDGLGGAPLLSGCTARFQCKASFQYEGGDHIIFVGEVQEFDRSDRAPLVFQAGKYSLAAAKACALSLSQSGRGHGPDNSFGENFLGYLAGRAHYQIYNNVRQQLLKYQLTDAEFFALSVLSVRDGRALEEVNDLISYTGQEITRELLQGLRERGLLQQDEQQLLHLTPLGRRAVLTAIAAAKAIESDLLAKLEPAEVVLLKGLLKKLILQTDPGLPDLWEDPAWGEDEPAAADES